MKENLPGYAKIISKIESIADVYLFDFNVSNEAITQAIRYLDSEERKRARSYQNEKDRFAFILARSGLKRILADYTQSYTDQIRFSYGKYGKPHYTFQGRSIEFNLSKSEGYALLAISQSGPVGVDIEKITPIPEIDELIRSHFSDSEAKWIHSFTGNEKWEAFYAVWTRKESIIKASGLGLSCSLASFSSIPSNGHFKFCWNEATPRPSIPEHPLKLDSIVTRMLDVPHGYVAALSSYR